MEPMSSVRVDLETGLSLEGREGGEEGEGAPLLPHDTTPHHTTMVRDRVADVHVSVDTRLHEAVLAQDLCAIRDLLAAGADPAALDAVGMTPVHLCIHWKLLRPFQVLLFTWKGAASLRDVNGWPALTVAVAHGWLDGVCTALIAGADFSRYSDDFDRELSGSSSLYPHMPPLEMWDIFDQTPIHMAVIVGGTAILDKILAYGDQTTIIDCMNRFGETPLYKAIYSGNLAAVRVLLRRGASVNKVSRSHNTALHVAAGQPRIMEYILNNTEVDNVANNGGLAAIHLAVRCNEPRTVKMLLDKFNDIDRKTVTTGCTVLHIAAQYASKDAAEVIFERDQEAKLLVMNNNAGDAPLHIAVDNNNRTLAALYLRKGAMLSAKGRDGKTALEKIVATFHDAPTFLDQVFSECINFHPESEDVVVVDYQMLTRSPNMTQIQFLGELKSCGQKQMLVHPLIESLLYLKWRRLLPLFFMDMVGYLTFLISYTYFVLDKFYDRDTKSTETHWYSFEINNVFYSSFLVLLTEGFNIYGKKFRYLMQIQSVGKALCLVLVLTASCALKYCEPSDSQRHVACAALLLCWLQAMYIVSRFFQWGYYAHMLRQVAINILKILATVIYPVIGFAFCFMIQYRSTSPFNNPFVAIVKTLVMMTSEFDYEGLFDPEKHKNELEETDTAVRALFLIFVIFVAIVLMNFMTGVAVSDIHKLNLTGKVWRLDQQLEQLTTMDYQFTFGGSRYHNAIFYRLKTNNQGKITCYDEQQNMFETTVFSKWFYMFINYETFPSSLHEALVVIAKRKKEQMKEDRVKTQYRIKVDALYDAVVGNAVPSQRNGRADGNNFDVRTHDTRSKLDEQILSLNHGLADVNIKVNRMASDIASIKEMLSAIAKGTSVTNEEVY